MSSGLTVVAICRSLGALHCFPRSRGRRDLSLLPAGHCQASKELTFC